MVERSACLPVGRSPMKNHQGDAAGFQKKLPGLFQDFMGVDAHMAFVENTLAIFDEQNLWTFVPHIEGFGYLVGNRPIGNKIEEITINGLVQGMTLQPVQYHTADTTPGAVLEN